MKDGLTNHQHLSIFPPSNHEDLPIPPPTPPPPPPPPESAPHASPFVDPFSDVYHPSPPLPSNANHNHSNSNNNNNNCALVFRWFDFALHFWNSKLDSFLTRISSSGFFSSFRSLVATASFLGFVWYWVLPWRRKRINSGEESVEHLKSLIQSKDEKIIQLLEQIAHMNKVLLTRYKIPVSKAS